MIPLLPSIVVYAAITIASGLWSKFVEGGSKGIWFGLVMGALALVAAALVKAGRKKKTAGMILAAVTGIFVGGWFAWEVIVMKSFDAPPRMYVMIAASAWLGWTLWNNR